MKVLQINSVCGVGSTGRIATNINTILIEHGYESYIAYGRDVPRNSNSSIRIGSKYDNYSHVALTRLFDKHGFGSKKATKEFIAEIETIDPDVIHLHNIHGYYINIEVLFEYLKKTNKPVIWTLHDCWSFTGHCTYFDYVGCEKWKNECYRCPQKGEYPSSKILDRSAVNYNTKKDLFTSVKNLTIVTPSQWLATLVKQSFLSKYDVEVIPNGIDLTIFKPTNSNFREIYKIEDKYIVLGVASIWDRRKGLDTFIELSNKLDSRYQVVVVGVTEKQKSNLPEKIIGITRTNNIEELVEIYSTADVFVNPTLEDNFPTTNLEALACGTPVITYDTGGSPESVDSKSGFIVEKGNINGIYEQISNITNKKKPIKNCEDRASLFNMEDKFMNYVDLYNHVYKRTKDKEI